MTRAPSIAQILSLHTTLDAMDVRLMISKAVGRSMSWVYAHPEATINDEEYATLRCWIDRRLDGWSVSHITGEKEFFGLQYLITKNVLSPREETEILVELTLKELPRGGRFADLGTGSGAIAVAVGHRRPDAVGLAIDISPRAAECAMANVRTHALRNVFGLVGSWADAIADHSLDVLVSNPPYIKEGDAWLLGDGVSREPSLALTSGTDGLCALKNLIAASRRVLQPKGCCIVEHGAEQRDEVVALFRADGYENLDTADDIAGLPRAVVARLS